MKNYSILLAAGKGTRMVSELTEFNKVCYPILGKPVLGYVFDAIKPLEFENIIVAGFGKEKTEELFSSVAKIVVQEEQLGTGDAVKVALKAIDDDEGDTIISYGDAPLLTSKTIKAMYHKHVKEKNDATILTSVMSESKGYNRVVRNEKTLKILKINDVKEAKNSSFQALEVDAGVYVIKTKLLKKYINELQLDHSGELSLINIFELMINNGCVVDAYISSESIETFSINNRFHLSYAARIIKNRVNQELMLNGVSIEDPRTTYISPDVKVGSDTIIHPNTTISGKSIIGKNNEIGPNAILENVEVGDRNRIVSSHISNSVIKNHTNIGPYAIVSNATIENEKEVKGNYLESH